MISPSPVIGRRMGRPSMNLEETKVRLIAGAKDRIIALVGAQRMAAFIRDAVEEKLQREEASSIANGKPKPLARP